MTDFIRCKRCNKNLIDEEFDSHLCSSITSGYKDIDIDYYIITKEPKMNRETILAKGLDGIMYILTIIPKKLSDKLSLTDESLQSDKDSENRRRLDRTVNSIIHLLGIIIV
jgi:hypothetical protein